MALIKCSECGNSVSDTAKTCPKCGFKIVSEAKKEKKEKNKNIIGVIISIAVIVIILGGLGLFFLNKHRVSSYKEKYENIVDKIYNSADKIEDTLILYRKVWYNTIFEEDDDETDKYTKDTSGKFNDDFI